MKRFRVTYEVVAEIDIDESVLSDEEVRKWTYPPMTTDEDVAGFIAYQRVILGCNHVEGLTPEQQSLVHDVTRVDDMIDTEEIPNE